MQPCFYRLVNVVIDVNSVRAFTQLDKQTQGNKLFFSIFLENREKLMIFGDEIEVLTAWQKLNKILEVK